MILDVYDSPWITCKMDTGEEKVFGIRECLEKAKKIKKIYVQHVKTDIDQIAPYILMEMILTRVYRPADEFDKLDILESGSFDLDRVDKYIDDCRKKGISFDIFDPRRPFLQCGEEMFHAKKDKKSAGFLDPVLPTGNALAFYHNDTEKNIYNLEEIQVMYPEQYLASLVRNHMIRSASGGYIASGFVVGRPPLFIVAHGNSLFETVLFSMHVEGDAALRENDIPMWEQKYYHMPITSLINEQKLGHLASSLYPVIAVRFGDIEDGMVKSVYCANLYDKTGDPRKWIDEENKPQTYGELFYKNATHLLCSYVKVKNEIALMPKKLNLEESSWISVISSDIDLAGTGIAATGFEALKFLSFLRDNDYDICEQEERIPCSIYGLVIATKTEPTYMQTQDNVSFPASALVDTVVRRKLLQIIDTTKKTGMTLKFYLRKLEEEIYGMEIKAGQESDDIGQICNRFQQLVADRVMLKDGWIELLSKQPGMDIMEFINQIHKDAQNAFEEYPIMKNGFIKKNKYGNILYAALSKEMC